VKLKCSGGGLEQYSPLFAVVLARGPRWTPPITALISVQMSAAFDPCILPEETATLSNRNCQDTRPHSACRSRLVSTDREHAVFREARTSSSRMGESPATSKTLVDHLVELQHAMCQSQANILAMVKQTLEEAKLLEHTSTTARREDAISRTKIESIDDSRVYSTYEPSLADEAAHACPNSFLTSDGLPSHPRRSQHIRMSSACSGDDMSSNEVEEELPGKVSRIVDECKQMTERPTSSTTRANDQSARVSHPLWAQPVTSHTEEPPASPLQPVDSNTPAARGRYPQQVSRLLSFPTKASIRRASIFPDYITMKHAARDALLRHQYTVRDHYHESGPAQAIARSERLEQVTVSMVAINAIWLAIDADYNREPLRQPIVFVIVENLFCLYFGFEWCIRFAAFKNKRKCLRDTWFVFDTILISFAIFDAWIIGLFLLVAGSSGASLFTNSAVLRLLRMLRLFRMSRMVHIFRALPELIFLLRGIMTAARSVCFTFVLLLFIVYMFAVSCVQLSKGSNLGRTVFTGTLKSMLTLVLNTVIPDMAQFVELVSEQNIYCGILTVGFIIIGSITLMNMLIGVLVHVVNTVAIVEREQLDMQFVKTQLERLWHDHELDMDGNDQISHSEFEGMLLVPEVVTVLHSVGVDTVGLSDIAATAFRDQDSLSFPEFIDMVLQLRGSNGATVRDVVDLRKFVAQELRHLESVLGKHRWAIRPACTPDPMLS